MKLNLSLLLLLSLPWLATAQQFHLQPNGWVEVKVYLSVSSGQPGSVSWTTVVPKQFPEPTIRIEPTTGNAALLCTKKASSCRATGVFPAAFAGPIATYRYSVPSKPGTYKVELRQGTITGGSGVLSFRSGVSITLSPGGMPNQGPIPTSTMVTFVVK
jgi:hypothetical protein